MGHLIANTKVLPGNEAFDNLGKYREPVTNPRLSVNPGVDYFNYL